VLTISFGKAFHTPLVMVPAVSWNDVVVYATLNFDIWLDGYYIVLTIS
jgi:Sec-independent protein secretion pathway component TatC